MPPLAPRKNVLLPSAFSVRTAEPGKRADMAFALEDGELVGVVDGNRAE